MMDDGQTIFNRLTGITQSLASVRNLDGLGAAIHQIVEDTISVEYSGIFMPDFGTRDLRMRHSKGFSPEEQREAERTAWDRHPGWVIRNKQMLHVPNTDEDNRTQSSKRAHHVRSRLWLPIIADGEAVGAMGLASTTIGAFTDEHVVVLQYAATTSGFMYANLRDKWSLEQQFVLAEEQRRELIALSSPLVEVSDGVIVMPIIGRLNAERAQQLTTKLLDVIATRGLRAVILDLTGVATIDAASVEYLGRIHQAVRLLGSNCVFTGISGQTAALMTELGRDIELWKTFATVRQALKMLSPAASAATAPRA